MKRLGPRPIARSIRVRGDSLALALNLGIVLAYGGLVILAIAQRLTWMADFTSQYTGAMMVREGLGGQLYAFALQASVQQRILGGRHLGDGLLPFNHPPYVALLLVPLTFLPLDWAYGFWLGFNLMAWGGLLWAVWRAHPDWSRRERALALLAWTALPAWLRAVMLGAFSVWETVVLWAFARAMQRGHDERAGLWLALGGLHPTVIVFPWLALLGARRWRAFGAWMAAMALMAGISAAWLGPGVWMGFLRAVWATAQARDHPGIAPGHMENLRGALFTLFGPRAWGAIQGIAWGAFLIGAFGILALWRRTGWTASPRTRLQLGLTVLAGLLLSPHLNPQDGLLMGLPALWLYAALRESGKLRRAFGTLAVLSPAAFLFGERMVGTRLGIRIPVLGMVALAVGLILALRHHTDGKPGISGGDAA